MENSILGKLLTPQEREEKFNIIKKQQEEEKIAKEKERLAEQQRLSETRLKEEIIDWINLNISYCNLYKTQTFDAYGCSLDFLKNIEKELNNYNYTMTYPINTSYNRDNFGDSIFQISSLGNP